uniref:Uncharacterized protein n=1 Tax=Acrobeloides nanus TaxID=290746 RepID=A0A914C791_9BILA
MVARKLLIICLIAFSISSVYSQNTNQQGLLQNRLKFYNDLTPDQQDQFIKIVNNDSLSFNQKYAQLRQFDQQLNPNQQNEFNTYYKSLQADNKEYYDILNNSFSKLSPDAAPYGQQLLPLLESQDLPFEQIIQQIQNIVDKAPSRVRRELQRVLSQVLMQV